MRAYGDLQYPGTAGMGYLSVVMDNFSIKPVYTNSVSGTVYYDQNVNGSLDTNELGLNGVQVKLFSQGSTIALQTVTTQNVPHLGEYSFANIPDGTYTVALVGENLYSQITEPVTNNPTLISGYTHAKQGHDLSIIDHNYPPENQPGLWCQWIPNEDGTAICWDGGEKFYNSIEWTSL
jgi:hypothetical protein